MASDVPASVASEAQAVRTRPHWFWELVLVTALFSAYNIGRWIGRGQAGSAFRNARELWDVERFLWLPNEELVQRVIMRADALVEAANVYYVTVHLPATIVFLLWLYWRRPVHYVWIRNVMAWLTMCALVVHLVYPLAPPRMLPESGMIDTGRRFGPSAYSGAPETDSMANQFAAMPSLHVGWAVVLAMGLIVATGTRWRWLWLIHPLITMFVVVATANHYWLDGIVACAILGGVLYFIRPPLGSSSDVPPLLTGAAVTTRAPATEP